MNNKVKILVGYHKKADIFKDDIFIPIHLGRDISKVNAHDGQIKDDDLKWLYENMIGDNTGENISKMNRNLNELTGIFWAWKNYEIIGNPEYIGFAHYRRMFIVDPEFYIKNRMPLWTSGVPLFSSIEKFISISKYNDIGNIVENYDMIIPEICNIWYKSPSLTHNRDMYAHHTNRPLDFDWMLKYIEMNYPNYYSAAKKIYYGHYKFLYNMFVMKKQLFFEYADFLFDIIFSMYSKSDFSPDPILKNPINSTRACGYMAEYLTTIFIFKKIQEDNLKIKRLNVGFIDKVNPSEIIIWKKKLKKFIILNIITLGLIVKIKNKKNEYKEKLKNLN